MANTPKRRTLSTKITLMFLAMLVIVMAAIGFATYRINYNSVLKDYNGVAEGAGKLTAGMIDTEKIDQWMENGADDAYLETAELLKDIRRAYSLTYLYASLPCFDENGVPVNDTIYLFDAMLEGENPDMFGTLGAHSGEVDVYEQLRYLYENNVTIKSDVITRSEFGWLLSVYVPLCGSGDQVVGWIGVDIEMTDVMNSIRYQTAITVSLIFAAITVFAVLFILYIRRDVVLPVRELSTAMSRFVLEDSSRLDYKPVNTISTGDEIEQMSSDFNSMARSILDYTVNLEKTTAEKERMRADLDVAAQIRASLCSIGEASFPDRSDFQLHASMKNTVFNRSSYCDAFLTDENHLFLVVGESVGRSLAAMLSVALAATNIRCCARMGYQPGRIAMETGNQLSGICKDNKDLTVQAIIVQIDLRTGDMRFVNAGMPPILRKDTGEEFAFTEGGTAFRLGEMAGISYAQQTLHLSQGNTLLLTSSGVPGMKNESGLEFTSAYVQSGINLVAGREYELSRMSDLMERMLDSFRGSAELESDTSMLFFRYFG